MQEGVPMVKTGDGMINAMVTVRLEPALQQSKPLRRRQFFTAVTICCVACSLRAQQPSEPVIPNPINGENYYLVDQASGLQADLNAGSTGAGATLVQDTRSFTSLTQRWAVTLAPSGNWKISNLSNGLCMDTDPSSTSVATVQQPCAINKPTQEWIFAYETNGYYTIQNASNGLLLDVTGSATTAGANLIQTALSPAANQSQLWLLRPAFLRGVDNALLVKQEADRLAAPSATSFFNDAGQIEDPLLILKDHGVNMVRLRPTPLVVPGTSTALYNTYTLGSSVSIPATCTGNGCTAETDAADLALAKRARQLGMSVELTVLFDGASSTAAPAAWDGYTVSQVSSAIYTYVKAQVEEYRAAGVMPDIVSIGNEVDTGFMATGVARSASGSPSGSYNSAAFTNFADYQIQGMQAVLDAASDPALGPAIPAPLRCIHTTPSWPISSFYPEATRAGIPYDMACESYYPIYHGPLTAAQAAAPTTGPGCTSPTSAETEQANITNGVAAIQKPVLFIEIAEHYETGFDTSDCFYPNTRAGQRQFALDIQGVTKSLSSNLGAGMTWWDATGTNVPATGEGYANYNEAGYPADLFNWDGLTLFDDADNGNYVDVFMAPTYNAALPALTALGGKLDPTLTYKFVNAGDGRILETAAALTASGSALDTGLNTEITSQNQEWQITSDNNGYFQIASLNPAVPTNVLDSQGLNATGSPVVQASAVSDSPSQEWDIVSAGNGYFAIQNDSSGLVLAAVTSASQPADTIQQESPSSTNADWITPAGMDQMWQIIPVHIVAASTPAKLVFDPAPIASFSSGGNLGVIAVELENTAGVLTGSTSSTVTLTITGPVNFSRTETMTSTAGLASFDLSGLTLTTAGIYTISATSPSLTSASATLSVTAASVTATSTVLSAPATATVGSSVTLNATVTGVSGTPSPTGSVTFLNGSTVLGSSTLNSSRVATISMTSLPVGANSITANYGGDNSNAPSSSNVVSITITAAPDFTVTLSPAVATITNGSTATSSVRITSANGFASAIALTCSGLPSFATCAFSPASVTPSAAAATSTLTIATNVQVASIDNNAPRGRRTSPSVHAFAKSGVLAALLFLPVLFLTKRRVFLLRTAGMFVVAVIALQVLSGCGGSSNSLTPPVGSTTPSGQYTVTIKAATASLTHSASFELTVQ
jgi:arabinogalactan endo-1,4-beta-galactosidase